MGLFLRSIAQLSLTFVTLTGEPKQVLVVRRREGRADKLGDKFVSVLRWMRKRKHYF